MNSAQIDQRENDLVFVSGALKLNTVKRLFRGIDFGRYSGRQVRISLSGVESIDSAGVALCLDWVSQGAEEGVQVVFQDAPEQMLRLASMNQLDSLFSESNGSSTQ